MGLAAAIVVASWPAGILLRRLLRNRIGRWASRTESKADDLLIDSLRRPIVGWSILLGIFAAIKVAGVPAEWAHLSDKAILIIFVVSATFWLANFASGLLALASTGRDGDALPVAGVVQNVIRFAILVTGTIVLLGTMGISITPIVTTLGVGGLAVALGLQETLANVFAGIHITMAKNIRVGDFVRLESGEEGTIEDIGWRTTRVRMLPNNVVLVPNSRLGQSVVTNYELPSKDLAVLVPVGVHYGSDLGHVEDVTCDVAREVMQQVPGGVPEFEPFIRYNAFGESSVDFTVILRGRDFVSRYLIMHEFIKRLHHRYNREGIVIPFPIRALNFDQEKSGSVQMGFEPAHEVRMGRTNDETKSAEER
ncbi:MAG: mechanosensitive ion channel family protein [Candidatus Zixiibacteriota bacterium]